MNKERNNDRLLGVLSRLGMDMTEYPKGISWSQEISLFRKKMELLATTSGYHRLLKSLYASNDLDEFNSYIFEVLFAYDFESRGYPLKYEVKQMDYGNSSIDFCYQLPESRKLYFELRNVQQRKLITDSIDHQLLPESCARL
ncbi:MAG: hypothetical protein WAW31_10035 [Smithella sp.]|jgi:hypothetical protein